VPTVIGRVVVLVPTVSHCVWEDVQEDRDLELSGVDVLMRGAGHPSCGPGFVPVFTDDKGNPIRRQRWNEIWNRAAQAADLPPGATPHDLRHYYASLLIAKGGSVKAVQVMLRHRTATETLNTYAHLWPEDNALVRRAVDAELSAVVGLRSSEPTADIPRTSGSQEG
jgi:integrase